MKFPRKTPINLVRNRILIMLNGGGPRTNSELAVLLNNTRGAIAGANGFNVSLGYVVYERTKGEKEVTYQITTEGVAYLKTLPRVRMVDPAVRPAPVRDRLLEALKKGITAKNWQGVTNSQGQLYKQIWELKQLGYVISKSKEGVHVTYRLVSSPS